MTPAKNEHTENSPRNGSSGWSAIAPYLNEIQKIPLLSSREEKQLARRVAQGDAEARDLLIRSNLRLVVNTARHFVGRGLSVEDLIEEGNLGLMRAVESYDAEAPTRFSTYAVYWIRQSMRRAVINQGKSLRFPAYLVNLMTKWNRAARVLEDKLGRPPTDDEVAGLMQLTKRKKDVVVWALNVLRALPSKQNNALDDDMNMEDMIMDQRFAGVDELVHRKDCLERIFQSIHLLDDQEAEILRMRFGLEGGESMGIVDTARRLCITRDRARYLEKKALERLRTLSRGGWG